MNAAYLDFSKPLDAVSHSIIISCTGELCVQPSEVGEKLVDLSSSRNDQWFEIYLVARYEKCASEDNTGIDAILCFHE